MNKKNLPNVKAQSDLIFFLPHSVRSCRFLSCHSSITFQSAGIRRIELVKSLLVFSVAGYPETIYYLSKHIINRLFYIAYFYEKKTYITNVAWNYSKKLFVKKCKHYHSFAKGALSSPKNFNLRGEEKIHSLQFWTKSGYGNFLKAPENVY